MFLSLASDNHKSASGTTCSQASSDLSKLLLSNTLPMNGKFIESVEEFRKKIEDQFRESASESVSKGIGDDLCTTFLNKAIRELNLLYLERADANYFKDKGKHAMTPQDLLDGKYIEVIPKDFQRDEKEKSEMIYFYNEETKHWDNKMSW